MADLTERESEAIVLAANVREECDLMQQELESLTQVLFEGLKMQFV